MVVQIRQPVHCFLVRAHLLRVRNFHIFRVTESMQNARLVVDFPYIILCLVSKPGRGYTDGATKHLCCSHSRTQLTGISSI